MHFVRACTASPSPTKEDFVFFPYISHSVIGIDPSFGPVLYIQYNKLFSFNTFNVLKQVWDTLKPLLNSFFL